MKNILLYIAAFCCIASVTLAAERRLDSTLLVTKKGLTVVDGTGPIQYKCGREWSVAFTQNGRTATLRTRNGQWTLTGLSSQIAVAAVSEGAPLVSGIAAAVGVSGSDLQTVTTKTLQIAGALAANIGKPTFDAALAAAVAVANDIFDAEGIHPADFTDDIIRAIALLGPSGTVVDASETTVDDIHKEAKKTIGTILNAFASSGALSH